MRYLTAAEALVVAGAVTGVDEQTLLRITDIGLLESALHAPQARFGDAEFYPELCQVGICGWEECEGRRCCIDEATQYVACQSPTRRRHRPSHPTAHIRLGGMIGVGVARPGWAVGFHVELIQAALSGPFPPSPVACVTPSP